VLARVDSSRTLDIDAVGTGALLAPFCVAAVEESGGLVFEPGLVSRCLVRTPKCSPSLAVNLLLLRVSNSSLALLPRSSRTRRNASMRSSGVACCIRRGFRTSQNPERRREARWEEAGSSDSSGGGRSSCAEWAEAAPGEFGLSAAGRRSIRLQTVSRWQYDYVK